MDVSEIVTVRFQGEGYLLNGSLSVPTAEGNRHYRAIQEWIALGNTPDPEFTQAELDQQKVNEENQWVVDELNNADVEINKHLDGYNRVRGSSVGAWRAYRNQLRDRVIDGVIQGDPSEAGRPQRPV